MNNTMNCKICGSSEFCTNDGITYCTECQSQIEETQAEEAVEHTCKESGSSAAKKTSTEKIKEYNDWLTVECYNHILFMQVSALIKLGASQNLKKTVFHIWSKYLEKCEIAFRTDFQSNDGKPHLGPVPSRRDIQILYGDKIAYRQRKRRASEVSVNSLASEGSPNVSNVSDTDNSTDVDSVASEKSCEKKKYSCHAKKLLRKSRLNAKNSNKYNKQVFNMALPKTLSICYLGLLYTEDKLSLLDLIRFVYEEKIPYVNLIDKLPSSLKLQGLSDRVIFQTYTVPNAYSILKLSRNIAVFLKLPEFKEPSVFLAVSRFVKELNLPDDIKSVIKILIEKYMEELSNKQKKHILLDVPHDYQALAFIVISLKLLFVLDDKFEIEHSKVMNKLNAICEDRKYFEWKEWKEHSEIKEYLLLCEKPYYCCINKLDSLSADTIISKCVFTRLKLSSVEDSIQRNYLMERLAAKRNISTMLSKVVNIPSCKGNEPTSFPLRSAVNYFVQEWNSLPMFKETQEIDFTALKKDFSSQSLLFNPLQFDNEDNKLSYLLMTSLYLPETMVDIGHKYYKRVNFCQQVIRTTSKYWFLKPSRSRFTNCLDWFENLPYSFRWLLNFISKYAWCDNIALYNEIVTIEKLLFIRKNNIFSKRLSVLSNKINIDF